MSDTTVHTEMITSRSDVQSTSLLGTSIPEAMDIGTAPIQPHQPVQPNNFPPPKTDKPRPHVCTTCGRCFARLEHLKRHERSHTKEKPFECPECTRCFARRDLLLRHQQKLHMSTTAPARPRGSRRESSSSNTPAKVRKNSSSQAGASGTMRPRANTISHVQMDALNGSGSAVANSTNVSASPRKRPGHSTHPSLVGLPTLSSFEYRGVTAMPRNRPSAGLPKIETQGLPMHLDGNLRTAPAFQNFPGGFTHDQLFSPGTINPAHLHFSDSPNTLAFDTPISPFLPNFNYMTTPGVDDGTFDWVNGFNASMTFGCETNEYAIDESSPSAMSTGSPVPDVMPEVFNQPNAQSTGAWQPSALSQAPMLADYTMDMSPFLQVDVKNSTSPNSGLEEHQFHPHLGLQSSPFLPDVANALGLHPSFISNAETPTASSASVRSSNRHSSVTSVGAEAITDATRAALITCLSQSQPAHHRNFSSPTGVKPKLGNGHARSHSVGTFNLPSTADLQRYVTAYTQYFHPHLPFLHIPTLSFDSPVHANPSRTVDPLSSHNSAIAEGTGCLILAMAAIGALYEFDNAASQELFEKSKKMLQAYLEERRKTDISITAHKRNEMNGDASVDTPLWLVQAMLLNVIYGHNCGDQVSAEIASTHCAALISLARSADLARPAGGMRTTMHDSLEGGWSNPTGGELVWYNWKVNEEKKRTLYAVYILSSMLVSAYNHSPALTNSEILLDLPCEEDIWAADSYESWMQLGGKQSIMARSVSFAEALGWLLGAGSRQQIQNGTSRLHHPFQAAAPPDVQQAILPISTFGCLILIHSLHNYIWETRQRHLGRQWTSAETEAMHAHIEPALIAWHQAWKSHPHHSLERPNPFGMGPLSADSIPLLDMAYVRLFVNLGRSKEAFWQRDWEQMSYEIARGAEIVQHAENDNQTTGFAQPNGFGNMDPLSPASQDVQSTRREQQLRKAAYHAAHSLCTSERLGVTFADFTSRELPIVSAMCAFDCAQVLAEWVTTIQERIGKFLGVLGRDKIDFEQIPAIMMLDSEDVRLFEKIEEFLRNMELKKAMIEAGTGHTKMNISRTKPQLNAYGSKILLVTLEMLEQSAVWPVIRVMSHSLESQAQFMEERALRSLQHCNTNGNHSQGQIEPVQQNNSLDTGVKTESVF